MRYTWNTILNISFFQFFPLFKSLDFYTDLPSNDAYINLDIQNAFSDEKFRVITSQHIDLCDGITQVKDETTTCPSTNKWYSRSIPVDLPKIDPQKLPLWSKEDYFTGDMKIYNNIHHDQLLGQCTFQIRVYRIDCSIHKIHYSPPTPYKWLLIILICFTWWRLKQIDKENV